MFRIIAVAILLSLSACHYAEAASITISLSRQMLYLETDDQFMDFQIASGKKSTPTPKGSYEVLSITRNPTWHVPLSIQKEPSFIKQFGEGTTVVPPGPGNPIVGYFIRLTHGGVGIHGTNSLKSIGKARSHGCIRMRPNDVRIIVKYIERGTPVTIMD